MDNFAIDLGKVKETDGYKKIMNYLNGIIDELPFQVSLLKFRKKYKIPHDGFKRKDYPSRLVFREDFNDDLDAFCSETIGLDRNWREVVKDYILFNDLESDTFAASMFDILDLNFQLNIFPSYDAELRAIVEDLQEKAKTYPVAILINAYSSERDIIDYVKKLYKTAIEPVQLSYRNKKIKIGKIRKRSALVKERNDFIADNDKMSSKEIVSLVSDKYGKIMDYTHVNSIRSKKKKATKELKKYR